MANKDNRPLIFIIVLSAAFLLGFLLSGCSEAKKNAKALNRVETDVTLLNHAWGKGSELWPCSNDTVHSTKSDTLSLVLLDTVFKQIEGTQHTLLFRDRQNNTDPIFMGNPDTMQITITKTFVVHDTTWAVITDRRREKTMADTIIRWAGIIKAHEARSAELMQRITDDKKSHTRSMWRLGLVLGGAVILLTLVFGLVIRTKI